MKNCIGIKQLFNEKEFKELTENRLELIKSISGHIKSIKAKVTLMIEERKKANKLEHAADKAQAYGKKVKPHLDEIRAHVDALELVIDNELWPLPKYRELLFIN